MCKTEAFLLDYLNRKVWVTAKREFVRDIVSVGFNKYNLYELEKLSSGEYADLILQLDELRAYITGKNLTIDEIQMVLARFARELMCSDLEPDLIHELNDSAWAVIKTLDYVKSL